MKKTTLKKIILLALFPAALFSCKKKETTEQVTPQETEKPATFLVSSQKLSTQSDTVLRQATNLLPDLKPLSPGIKYSVDVYKLVYKTTYKGAEIQASGLVCLPQNDTLKVSTVSFQHGTMFNNADVPSANAVQQLLIAALASSGYAVVAPDFIGFGASVAQTHPYYAVQYSASSVRDMLSATLEFMSSQKVTLNKRLFLAGYSQGGNVTLATAKSIETSPLPGFTLTASAAGAGGYRLKGIFNTLFEKTSYTSPAYLIYTIQSYRNVYNWTTSLNYYFREPYASKIPALLNKNKNAGEINGELTDKLDSLFQPTFIQALKNGTETQFLNALNENSLDNWKPMKPIRFYHGTADEVVPYSDTDSTYQRMVRAGAPAVSFVPLAGKTHGSGALPMLTDVLAWFKTSFPE